MDGNRRGGQPLPEWSGEELRYLSPREVVNRFGWTAPSQRDELLADEARFFEELRARIPDQDGEPCAEARAVRPEQATAELSSRAAALGADLVGVTPVDPRYVYEGRTVPHRFAVMIAVRMELAELLRLPRPETQEEYIRVYNECGRIAVDLAAWIRSVGYAARAHTLVREDIAMLPHAAAAGLGELGKHGSLINRALGCSFRLAAVTTDLPLLPDSSRDEGVADFCRACRMCVTACPGDAIGDERQLVRGTERWIVDTEACAPFFGSHYACGICLQVCPFNAKAFGGVYRDDYVRTMHELDEPARRRTLAAALRPLERTSPAPER